MTDKKRLYRSLCRSLSDRSLSRNEIAGLAHEIVFYTIDCCHDEKVAEDLRVQFQALLQPSEFADLLENKIEYAQRLAVAEGELMGEEMQKLFSLIDEIEAMKLLGVQFKVREQKSLTEALRTRFASQPNIAKGVALRTVKPWSSHFWWYQVESMKRLPDHAD